MTVYRLSHTYIQTYIINLLSHAYYTVLYVAYVLLVNSIGNRRLCLRSLVRANTRLGVGGIFWFSLAIVINLKKNICLLIRPLSSHITQPRKSFFLHQILQKRKYQSTRLTWLQVPLSGKLTRYKFNIYITHKFGNTTCAPSGASGNKSKSCVLSV